MDPEVVQAIRYKLQKRFRRVNSADWQVFHYIVAQFVSFMQQQPMLSGVLDDLEKRLPEAEDAARRIFSERVPLLPETELEAAAMGLFLIKLCADPTNENHQIELDVGHLWPTDGGHATAIENFRRYFVEPLYEYVDEQLDDQRLTLSLLRRYKQKCEWFARKELFAAWDAETRQGERTLARHLYEYLHDQGLVFYVEPWSVSGEVDVIAAQADSPERVVADAKIFHPEKDHGRAYVVNAADQIYTYTRDYNESAGFLVIYNVSNTDLRLVLTGDSLSTPFLTRNNKTLFFVVIDLFPHELPASKRHGGPVLELTEVDFAAPN